jgi:uncharacterized protein YegP (UPF0339 family)
MSNYEIYQDNKDQWRWRLRADNGEIVAASEAYTREEDALRGAADAKRVSDEADVGDE